MTKTEMIKEVAKKATNNDVKYTQADVDAILTAYGEVVLEGLKGSIDDKERVPAPGLGNWTKKLTKGREGVSSLTGKPFKTEDKTVLVFKPSKTVKVLS